MKKVTLILVMALMGLVGYAQDAQALKYGYLSYDSVFKAMPEYATMQASMQTLRDKYEAEQKRVEDDFNKKYEEFLDGQASFPQTILQKRQSELQEMLDKNIAFKKESQRLLCKAECEAKAPLKERLAAVLAKVGEERGYAFILNTDGNVAPWLNSAMGEDISEVVKQLLNNK
jgi:outer membrane protein